MGIGKINEVVAALCAALLVFASMIGASAADPAPQGRVVMLGFEPPAKSTAAQSLRTALLRTAPPGSPSLQLDYLMGSDVSAEMNLPVLQSARLARGDVVVTSSAMLARAVVKHSPSQALIFVVTDNPSTVGLDQAASGPGSRRTGIWMLDSAHGKRLELLRDAAPGTRRVAVLVDSDWLEDPAGRDQVEQSARAVGLSIHWIVAESADELRAKLSPQRRGQFDAWYVPKSYLSFMAEAVVLQQIRRLAMPAIFGSGSAVEHGAALSYAQDASFVWGTVADLVHRVMAGEVPGTIPIERPRRYILSVRTGPETGAPPIAPAVVRRADRVH